MQLGKRILIKDLCDFEALAYILGMPQAEEGLVYSSRHIHINSYIRPTIRQSLQYLEKNKTLTIDLAMEARIFFTIKKPAL